MNIIDNYHLFSDGNRLLHHKIRPTSDSSENELIFTAEYIVLNRVNDNPFKFFDIKRNMMKFYYSEVRNGRKISHDNKTGMVAVNKNLDESIFKVGDRLWLHPRDVVYYGYRKYGWPFYPLLPLVSLANIISCARTWKHHPDRKELTTSGKLLAMVRNLSADLKLTQKICTWLIQRNPHFGSWEKVARIYFPDQEGYEHPIVTSIKRLD